MEPGMCIFASCNVLESDAGSMGGKGSTQTTVNYYLNVQSNIGVNGMNYVLTFVQNEYSSREPYVCAISKH